LARVVVATGLACACTAARAARTSPYEWIRASNGTVREVRGTCGAAVREQPARRVAGIKCGASEKPDERNQDKVISLVVESSAGGGDR
jgi:hypothetical protein